MKFIKLFCYDVKRGFLGTWKKYCGVVGMTFLFFVFFNLLYSAYGRWQAITGLPTVRATYGDAVFYIFAGMQKYIPDPTSPFLFPMIWLLLYIVLAWITLEYAANDLAAYGQQILIRTGGRTKWWLSKCIWNIITVAAFFCTIWLSLLIFCLAAGYPITLTLHASFLMNILDTQVTGNDSATTLLLATFVGTPLALIALNLLQMTLTLFMKPILSFCVTAAILVLSAYWLTPYLIGNYAMPMRNTAFLAAGMKFPAGILFALVLGGAAAAVGALRFRHYDILEIE